MFMNVWTSAIYLFNDTETTEICTDRHTLSQHDALPIAANASGAHHTSERAETREHSIFLKMDAHYSSIDRIDRFIHLRLAQSRPRIAGNSLPRSEEHTSELQSLMRISYAVFCLKKTNTLNEDQIICDTLHSTTHT